MENLMELLQKFDATLRKYNPKNYDKLQPPLTTSEVKGLLIRVNIDHPDTRALFEWKNGLDYTKGLRKKDKIFDFGILFSLESIVNRAVDHPHDNPNLIQIAGEASGDGLLFNNERGDNYGKIYLYSVSLLSIDDPYSYYDSLRSMIETTIVGYESEALKYDDSIEFLDEDTSSFNEIGKRLNPKSSWWSEMT